MVVKSTPTACGVAHYPSTNGKARVFPSALAYPPGRAKADRAAGKMGLRGKVEQGQGRVEWGEWKGGGTRNEGGQVGSRRGWVQ